jgi:hypothetical protein
LLLDQTSGEGPEGLVQKVVTAITDRELEGMDLDMNGLDAEEAALGLPGGLVVDDNNGSSDTTSTKEDVSEARVFEFLDHICQYSISPDACDK